MEVVIDEYRVCATTFPSPLTFPERTRRRVIQRPGKGLQFFAFPPFQLSTLCLPRFAGDRLRCRRGCVYGRATQLSCRFLAEQLGHPCVGGYVTTPVTWFVAIQRQLDAWLEGETEAADG